MIPSKMERIFSLVSDFLRVSLFWADFIFRAQLLEDFSRKPTKVCLRRLSLFRALKFSFCLSGILKLMTALLIILVS